MMGRLGKKTFLVRRAYLKHRSILGTAPTDVAGECGSWGINWSEEKNTTRKVGEGQVVEMIAYWLRKLKFK